MRIEYTIIAIQNGWLSDRAAVATTAREAARWAAEHTAAVEAYQVEARVERASGATASAVEIIPAGLTRREIAAEVAGIGDLARNEAWLEEASQA